MVKGAQEILTKTGQSEDKHGERKKYGIFLPELRIRVGQMDGAVSGMPGMEHDGGGAGGHRSGKDCAKGKGKRSLA